MPAGLMRTCGARSRHCWRATRPAAGFFNTGSLNALLTSAGGEVGNDNIAGQFVAARVHLTNFIRAVQGLVARGSLTASQAQPVLDGATAILEQIEGNHPKRAQADEGDPSF